MSTDVHLSRLGGGPDAVVGASKVAKSPRYSAEPNDYDGYAGAEGEWWGQGGGWGGYGEENAGAYYYDEGNGMWDIFEIDMYPMVFTLNEALEPQDIYAGFELDEKSLLFSLGADDLEEQMPPEWKSRPLKIHPEPTTRLDRKDSNARTPISDADAETPNKPGGAVGGSPRVGSSLAREVGSPLAGLEQLPPAATPPPRQTNEAREPSPVQDQASKSPAGTPLAPGESPVSPKIRISTSQLENLKLKMQALKQKKNLTPVGGSANDDEDSKDGDTLVDKPSTPASARKASARAPAGGAARANCPGMHGLKQFTTNEPGWVCSICDTKHPKFSILYGCRICDYDECQACVSANSQRGARGEREAAAPKRTAAPPVTAASRSRERSSSGIDSPAPPPARAPPSPGSPSKSSSPEERTTRQAGRRADGKKRSSKETRSPAARGRKAAAGSPGATRTAGRASKRRVPPPPPPPPPPGRDGGSKAALRRDGASASDSETATEDEWRPAAQTQARRAEARNPRLVPRKRQAAAATEDDDRASPPPATASRRGAAGGSARDDFDPPAPKRRAAAPALERATAASARASAQRSSSEEPAPKRPRTNALRTQAAASPVRPRVTATTAKDRDRDRDREKPLARAAAASRREEPAPASRRPAAPSPGASADTPTREAQAPRGRGRGRGGDDLLRRVLQAAAGGGRGRVRSR